MSNLRQKNKKLKGTLHYNLSECKGLRLANNSLRRKVDRLNHEANRYLNELQRAHMQIDYLEKRGNAFLNQICKTQELQANPMIFIDSNVL